MHSMDGLEVLDTGHKGGGRFWSFTVIVVQPYCFIEEKAIGHSLSSVKKTKRILMIAPLDI